MVNMYQEPLNRYTFNIATEVCVWHIYIYNLISGSFSLVGLWGGELSLFSHFCVLYFATNINTYYMIIKQKYLNITF